MMKEKELICKLRELRQIRPDKDWVVLTKELILGQEEKIELTPFSLVNWLRVFFVRPAYAGLVAVFIFFGLLGTFIFTQNSLPGELLYPVKRITEKAQEVFVSEAEKPQVSLELVEKRLTELTKIAQTNQVKKLAPAINEFQASVSEAAKNLSVIDATSTDVGTVKRVIDQAKNIKKAAKEVSESLGVVSDKEGLGELEEVITRVELQGVVIMLKDIISRLEGNLKIGALTKEEGEMLVKIKGLVEEGKYSEALELYLPKQ